MERTDVQAILLLRVCHANYQRSATPGGGPAVIEVGKKSCAEIDEREYDDVLCASMQPVCHQPQVNDDPTRCD
jgi:hypothetical protein